MFMGSSTSFKQDLHGMAGGLGYIHNCHHAGESPLLVRCERLKIHPVMINNDSIGVIKNSVLVGNSSVYWDFSHGSKLQKHEVLFGSSPLHTLLPMFINFIIKFILLYIYILQNDISNTLSPLIYSYTQHTYKPHTIIYIYLPINTFNYSN